MRAYPERGGSRNEAKRHSRSRTGRTSGTGILLIFEEGLIGNGVGVEVFGPFGDVGVRPVPKREHDQIFADAGFSLGGRLGEDNFAGDAFANGEYTEKVSMEVHSIRQIAEFLVNVKGLRGHIDLNVIVALKLEEVTDTGLEYLVVTIIPNHTYLVQEQERASLRDEVAKVLNVEVSDTGHRQFIHVGVDNPTTFQMLLSEFDEISRFTRTFLTEHKIEFIGVKIFAGEQMPNRSKGEQASENCE